MTDIILVAALVIILGAAAWYVIKEKKSGKKCIGCSYGGACSSCTACGKEEE